MKMPFDKKCNVDNKFSIWLLWSKQIIANMQKTVRRRMAKCFLINCKTLSHQNGLPVFNLNLSQPLTQQTEWYVRTLGHIWYIHDAYDLFRMSKKKHFKRYTVFNLASLNQVDSIRVGNAGQMQKHRRLELIILSGEGITLNKQHGLH